jgi:hypothetical protein
MSVPPLRFEAEDGAFAVELDAEALGSLAGGESLASPWKIAAEPDWETYEALRLLAAVFPGETIAALVALRPKGSPGHDADGVSAVLIDRGKTAESAHEALISTELDRDRRVRRVGVEIWTSEEPPPRRLAADRTRATTADGNGLERELALMEARLDGESGTAVFETLRPVG